MTSFLRPLLGQLLAHSAGPGGHDASRVFACVVSYPVSQTHRHCFFSPFIPLEVETKHGEANCHFAWQCGANGLHKPA